MKNIGLIVLAMLVGAFSTAAQARKSQPVVEADDYVNKEISEAANVWHCWYDGAVSVRCRLGEAAERAPEKAAVAVPAADPRLPDVVRMVWHKAAELADRIVTIPLHTIPFDMAMTGQLAEAVMCGGATQPCGVVFARSQALLADAVRRREVQLAARKFGRLALAD